MWKFVERVSASWIWKLSGPGILWSIKSTRCTSQNNRIKPKKNIFYSLLRSVATLNYILYGITNLKKIIVHFVFSYYCFKGLSLFCHKSIPGCQQSINQWQYFSVIIFPFWFVIWNEKLWFGNTKISDILLIFTWGKKVSSLFVQIQESFRPNQSIT